MQHDEDWIQTKMSRDAHMTQDDETCAVWEDLARQMLKDYFEHMDRWRSTSEELPTDESFVLALAEPDAAGKQWAFIRSYCNGAWLDSWGKPQNSGIGISHWKPHTLPVNVRERPHD